ncbi:hypothetical protein GCM10027036_15970 [Flavihumibacter cheonanensis]|uniref:hypothetical protein n=1 Tax=Flavihumibacter cheonanensis TaxID=1442385 RepID=UPI001EF8D7AD|nr:hypothetical protein [Flavihumibacter cheonanensis]MCG7750963.1 hypothetical protein [Flavihumibacter cheonanensis]
MRKTNHGLNPGELAFVFTGKVLAACLYGWLLLHYYGGDDTWVIHEDTLMEWRQMKSNPLRFFVYEIDLRQYITDMGWKEGLPYFRMKLEKAIINKPLGVFNFFSQGNFYVNMVAFSFMSFWGSFWLYQVLVHLLPAYKKWTFGVLFFYPPALFWLSGLRSDAMLFFFFSLFVSRLYRQWYIQATAKNIWIVVLAWIGMIVIKASFALLLLVPIFSWWLCARKKWNWRNVFFGTTVIALGAFFLSSVFPAPFNLPQAVTNVQQEFFALEGKTRVNLPALDSNPITYLKNLPAAVDNILLRPYPWDAKGILQYAMAAQNIFIICLIGFVFIRRFPGMIDLVPHALLWMLFFFSISFYLSIGYTVPFPGATIRYRVIPETMLVWLLSIGAMGSTITHYNIFNVYKKQKNI